MEANENRNIENNNNPFKDPPKQILQPQPIPLEPYNDFDLHWNQLLADDNATEWYPLGTVSSPYSNMTPQLDVVWARGWYNAIKPPITVPLDYYNRAGLNGGRTSPDLLQQYFPPTLCGPRWMRIDDLEWWIHEILPQMRCPFTLLTGDGIVDVPTMVSPYPQDIDRLLSSSYLEAWYAQNTVMLHPKLIPLPLGLPIHYGFPGSPHSAETVQTMLDIRQQQQKAPNNAFRQRSRKILLDLGTTEGGGPRAQARMQALEALEKCPERVEVKPVPTDPVTTWKQDYSTHQFAVVVRGTGWDTYRTWEFLLYGTVPIMLAGTPLDLLHLSAHTPVLQVQEWSDICQWSDEYYDALVDQYEGWIANAHRWLRPSLWVPRNQDEMELLCDTSPGCRDSPPQRPGMGPQKREVGLDLTPEERDALLEALLKNTSPEDMERLLVDEKIQEKVSDQLVLLRQHHSEPEQHPDFVACSQQCAALHTETVPCVMLGEAITFTCKEPAWSWTELFSMNRWF